ncbi:MAG: hypothetical protein ACC707_15490, partial [Thiohalomonadales bacterium]
IEFKNLTWQYAQNTATSIGNLQANITLKDNITTQSMQASSIISLRITTDKKLKISRIVLNDKNYSSSNPNQQSFFEPTIESDRDPFIDDSAPYDKSATNETSPISIDTPNSAELDRLIDHFIYAYELGNIEQLSRIFSEDMKTNKSTNINGVRKEYAELFSTTSDRKVKLSNLRWKFGKTHAKGSAQLEVIATTKNGKSEKLINGRIQFVAKRIDNIVRITHLYYIDHAE